MPEPYSAGMGSNNVILICIGHPAVDACSVAGKEEKLHGFRNQYLRTSYAFRNLSKTRSLEESQSSSKSCKLHNRQLIGAMTTNRDHSSSEIH